MIQLFLQKFKESTLSILAIALFLTGVGLITLKSISTGHEGNYFQQSFYKQLFFLLPALIVFLIAFFIPRHTIHRYIYGLYGFMILLILIPFLGEEIASTYRWIRIGLPIGFQPSEFAKWIVVIALARYLSDHNLEMNYFQ